MKDTLAPPASLQPPLFDLLARSWALPAGVTDSCFDTAGKSCAFALADGRLALVPIEEPDSALSRMRMEYDSGRSLIRPREKPVPPPHLTSPLTEGAPLLATSHLAGYLVASRAGGLHRVTPRGQELRLAAPQGEITAIAVDGKGRLAVAGADLVTLYREETMSRCDALLSQAPVMAMAFSPVEDLLAITSQGLLTLRRPEQDPERIELDATQVLAFSPLGDWLAGSSPEGFWLRRCGDGRMAVLGSFPAAPRALAFGQSTIFVAGAYRLTGWSLEQPPFDSPGTGALRSGGHGMVLTTQVACHPNRPLVAAGRADGAVSILQAGAPDEMALRHSEGSPVSSLTWSPDGLHLAIGTEDGSASLVTLPPQLFRA